MLSADLDIFGDFFAQYTQDGVWLTPAQARRLKALLHHYAEDARQLEGQPVPARQRPASANRDTVVNLDAFRRRLSGNGDHGGAA